MKFARDLSKVSARTGLAVALIGAAMLTACGGGEQEETFRASRIVAFGDENTLIRPDGSQYTINNRTVATSTPCSLTPVWIQYVAAEYGLSFAECAGAAPLPNAVMRAQVGATVSTVAQAMADMNATAAPLRAGDLVTLMVGAYDLMELVAATPAPTEPELAALRNAAFERGRALGSVVFDATARGAKVLITTVPDLANAPIGVRNELNANLLSILTRRFNDGLSDRLSEDPGGGGRNGAVLEVDQQIERYRRNYESQFSGFTNMTEAACNNAGVPFATADLPTCTTTDNSSFLWVGRFHFGLITHGQLGSDAVARLRANPL